MYLIKINLEEGVEKSTRSTEEAAGFDMYSPYDAKIDPGDYECIDLGVRIELHKGTKGVLTHRSGMNTKGIWAYGTIDSDYRGTLKVTLFNHGYSPLVIRKGDRICQLFIEEIPKVQLQVTKDPLEVTGRGEGGHGHTGR